MRLFTFGPQAGHPVDQFGSDFTLSPLMEPTGTAHVACLHLGAGGVVGEHEAVVGQLFCVVTGEGWVSGADGHRRSIGSGDAAYWRSGEMHAAGSETGLIAVVLQGDAFEVWAKPLGDNDQ